MSEGRELACALHFQLEGAIRLVDALGGCIVVTRLMSETGHPVQLLGEEAQPVPQESSQIAQFRCVALSGKTNHPALTHQSMLSGIVETGIALNIALAGQPFLAVPIRDAISPIKNNNTILGVLCVAWKADPAIQRFSSSDESFVNTASSMIATVLIRCPAARYVQPYSIQSLSHLGLQTLHVSTSSSGEGPKPAPLIYRSSSRSVLSSRRQKVDTDTIPSLHELCDVSATNSMLEEMLASEQKRVSELLTAQAALDRRLRSLQQDLRQSQATTQHCKMEEMSFRLSARLAQEALDERIITDEVKRHAKTRQFSVDDFMERATGRLARSSKSTPRPPSAQVSSSLHARKWA